MERRCWCPTRSAFFVSEIILMTAMATLSVLLLPAKHGMNLWRRRRLSGAFVEAQAALGERMYAAGIDDGEHGAKIIALDEKLRRAARLNGSTLALNVE